MKKIFGVLLLLILATSLFAATDGGSYKNVVTVPFRPALYSDPGTLAYKMFSNPADLARNRFILQLPTVSVTMYNVAKTMSAPSTAEAISKLTHRDFSKNNLVNLVTAMMLNVGTGRNDVITANSGLGMAIGKFGFSVDIGADFKTKRYPDSTEIQNLYNTELVPLENESISVAYGTRIYERDSSFLDLGASVHYAMKGYVVEVSAKQIADYIENGTDINFKARGGYAFPFDVALTYGILDGALRFNLSANNLNGYYHMKGYDISNLEDMAKIFTGGLTPVAGSDFILYTPWQLNAGLVWEPEVKVLNPVITFNIEDINGYIKEDLKTDGGRKSLAELVTHLVARVDLRIVKIINLSVAFQNGYPMLGAAVNLKGNTVEISYSFHEAGDLYGAKPVDALTLRVKLGFDSN